MGDRWGALPPPVAGDAGHRPAFPNWIVPPGHTSPLQPMQESLADHRHAARLSTGTPLHFSPATLTAAVGSEALQPRGSSRRHHPCRSNSNPHRAGRIRALDAATSPATGRAQSTAARGAARSSPQPRDRSETRARSWAWSGSPSSSGDTRAHPGAGRGEGVAPTGRAGGAAAPSRLDPSRRPHRWHHREIPSLESAAGQLVRTLVDGEVRGGPNVLIWDGADDRGGPLPAGVYFYQLDAPGIHGTRRTLLLHWVLILIQGVRTAPLSLALPIPVRKAANPRWTSPPKRRILVSGKSHPAPHRGGDTTARL